MQGFLQVILALTWGFVVANPTKAYASSTTVLNGALSATSTPCTDTDIAGKSSVSMRQGTTALQRMTARQTGDEIPSLQAAKLPVPAASSRLPDCLPNNRYLNFPSLIADPDNFLGSKRLPVSQTPYDRSWDRVKAISAPQALATKFRQHSGLSLLRAVNRWANENIRFVDDLHQDGRSDFWSDASETYRRRQGDCEDIAILKMQILAGAGIPRDAMYLTIARDRIRGADHAMLIVKYGGQHLLLDNATNQLVDASSVAGYQPIMSFSGNKKWLHGY